MKKTTSSSTAESVSPLSTLNSQLSAALAPLTRWYAAAGLIAPETRILAGVEMPEPYRQLLVHERDMTSTLESFHGGRIQLRVLGTAREGNRYRREVVLELEGSSKPVEFGATHLRLDALPPEAQRLVLEARRPFGAILRDLAIPYTSRPKAYFSVESDATMAAELRFTGLPTLFGRCNAISDPAGRVIGDIVEILPPTVATV